MRNNTLSRFSCSLVLCLALTGVGAVASVLQPQDLISMVQIGGESTSQVVISPDGRYVAYVTANPVGAAETQYSPLGSGRKTLWIADLRSSAAHRISDVGTNAWNPVWSPDSRQLAFYTGIGNHAVLAIYDVTTSALLRTGVTVRAPDSFYEDQGWWKATWLADSRRLIVDQPVAQSTSLKASAVMKPSPTPAVSIFLSTPPPPTIGIRSGHIITPAAPDEIPLQNLVLYDRVSRSSQTIAHRLEMSRFDVSPDGRLISYLISKGELDNDVNSRVIYDVGLIDVQTHSSHLIAKNILTNFSGVSFKWSPDSSKIAFVGGQIPSDMELTTSDSGASFPGHCYVIDVQKPVVSRRISDVLLSRHAFTSWSQDSSTFYASNEANSSIYAMNVASGTGRLLFTLDDGAFAVYQKLLSHVKDHDYLLATTNTGERRVYDADLERGTLKLAFHAYQDIFDPSFSSDGKEAAYVGEDPRRPRDVWIAKNGFQSTYQLTHLNPLIESRALGSAEDVTWESRSGVALNGVILLPAGYQPGERYPTVTWIYGGEPVVTWVRTAFGLTMIPEAPCFNFQLFASRGYAVFIPNSVLHVGTPMKDLADDVLPGIDKIVAMGVADPNRLGLYGQSYGGYSTMALLVQSDRFKAAVAMSGIYDIFAMFGTMYDDGGDWTSWSESEGGRMGGTPWNQQQRYIDNSPFFFLDKVNTPVLLEYGANDKFAAINSEEAFVSLRSLGKTAELLRYAGEDHVVTKPSNQIDLCHRIFAWFDRYLRPLAER
jgi:dipeptidyl aminopeptidase/acylaminoacyl peptidase